MIRHQHHDDRTSIFLETSDQSDKSTKRSWRLFVGGWVERTKSLEKDRFLAEEPQKNGRANRI